MNVAATLSEVFAPELFVLVVTVTVAGYELVGSGFSSRGLAGRIAAVLAAWGLAFAVYQGGPTLVSTSVPGGEDFFASIGLIVGFVVIWLAWDLGGWGELLPLYCLLLIGTSVVHILVVPLWDVSSHVTYAAVSTGFLVFVDRRFVVSLLIPVGLVWSRIAIDAHSVVESVGGLVFAAVVVAVAMSVGKVPQNQARISK